MADPIGSRGHPPLHTSALQDSKSNGTTPFVTTSPRSPKSEFAGAGAGVKAGFKFGPKQGVGVEVKAEAGGDNFGGFYVEGGGQGALNMPPIGGVNGEASGRYYPNDESGKFSRGKLAWSIEGGRKGASKGQSVEHQFDNNPVTPEHSGKRWDQVGAKTVERFGADNLERDGASRGMHIGIAGSETDYRFNPEGFRYEANSYLGAGYYREHDVLGLVTYDPPSAKAFVTDKYGVGIARVGIYGGSMEQQTYDGDWALDISADYRGKTPGNLGVAAREYAIGSYNSLTVLRGHPDLGGNARVLDGLGLGSEEAYLNHVEGAVSSSELPDDIVVERMDRAVRDAAIAMDADPSKTVAEAFAEQPGIDRRNPMERALSEGAPPDVALELALARANGDTRSNGNIMDEIKTSTLSPGAAMANDAIAFETVISGVTETPTDFDAVVAAGAARNAGDGRSAGALVTDYHDNDQIDGSNVFQANVGDQSYGVTPGGAVATMVMPDGSVRAAQTTLTPEEYANRQAAHDVASTTPRHVNQRKD